MTCVKLGILSSSEKWRRSVSKSTEKRKNEEHVILLGSLNRQTSSKCLRYIPLQCVAVQVSAELQQEVLMSLIQTDPDIIDYLLRRKLR